MSANLLEQRYVVAPLRPTPGGIYDKDAAFPAFAERVSALFPTAVEMALDFGFPEGEFVDELFGWAFFLGNSSERAKKKAHACGYRLNFTQQTFLLPTGPDDLPPDTAPMRRFIELLEARLHTADERPEAIDFLYVGHNDPFVMSASRGLPSFVVTVSLVDRDRRALRPEIEDMLSALSHDCRMLGGRVHLIKNVVADRSDLRAMHGDAGAEFRVLKKQFDPKGIFRNGFFERVFEA
jgi:hypothetical protein